jgi:hypothetical protein
MSPSVKYEFDAAVEAAATAFKEAQERQGIEPIWMHVSEAWERFRNMTDMVAAIQDEGGSAEGVKKMTRQFVAGLRGHGLYVAKRQLLGAEQCTSAWVRRSSFLSHVQKRREISGPGTKGGKQAFDYSRIWDMKS